MSLNTRARFLTMISIIFAIYSILWGTAPYTAINFPSRLILDLSDWPIDSLSVPLDRNTMWLSAIGAGLLGAVSIFLGGIVAPALKEGNQRIIRVTIMAMTFWYITDSAGSIAAGVSSNIVFNTLYLALVLIPLIGANKAKAV